VTNILTALADAKLDSIPLVCITGQVPQGLIGTDAFQEVDAYGLSIPITKHNFLVRRAEDLPRIIPEAFRLALSGRPGPVLVDIPKDVQTREFELSEWPEPGGADPLPAPHPAQVRRLAEMLGAAKRPMLCLGGGAVHSGASGAALALAEKAGLPTVMTLLGLGVMPVEHPLSLGMLGMHAARSANMALEECDLLLVAGARLDDRATGLASRFCPRAALIHIDIDAGEIDKIKKARMGIAADVGLTLSALTPLVEERPRTAWLDRVAELRRAYPPRAFSADPASAVGIIRRVADLAGEEATVVADVGQNQMWTAQAYPFSRPRGWLASGGLGTMGFGLPTAIGAALAGQDAAARGEGPGRRTVCFSGDGGLLMNVQELATAVEERADVTVVVLDNRALGLVRQQQNLFYGGRRFASQYSHGVDFAAVARGFGMRAFDLEREADPAAALAEALSGQGPCLVRAPIAAEEAVFPMVPPGAANIDMIGDMIGDMAGGMIRTGISTANGETDSQKAEGGIHARA
jgi:acetolactate synthase-1/2/3 large subunit